MVSAFSDEESNKLMAEQFIIVNKLQELGLRLRESEDSEVTEKAKNYIRYGVGRRIKTLWRCVQNIFELFPPSTYKPLLDEQRADVQINLEAFVINLYGVFENLALAFVSRHELNINDRKVSFFYEERNKHFPSAIKEYIDVDEGFSGWSAYFKENRNALAHRVPMYLPPSIPQPKDEDRYKQLTAQRIEYLSKKDVERAEQVQSELDRIVRDPCFWVVSHEQDINKIPPHPFYLHPQILSDCKTIVEFCDIFFRHWHEDNKT